MGKEELERVAVVCAVAAVCGRVAPVVNHGRYGVTYTIPALVAPLEHLVNHGVVFDEDVNQWHLQLLDTDQAIIRRWSNVEPLIEAHRLAH